MIDLSSPKRYEQIKNESIEKYLNELSKEDFENGIDNIVYIIFNILNIPENNGSIDNDYFNMIYLIIKEILNDWNDKMNGEIDNISDGSNLENDILTFKSIFDDIPNEYIHYFLLKKFEYDNENDYSESMEIESNNDRDVVHTKENEYVNTSEYVCYLHGLPQKEQKSKEWLNQRIENITASEVGTIMGITPVSWEIKNKLFTSKCGISDPLSSPAFDHGNKFEEVVCQIYESRVNKKVIEFGMIQHQGGNGIEPIKFFGASPDGITTDGVMLEIKAPWKREIVDKITPYYFSQVQHQMECCNLPLCDFVECKIRDSTFNIIVFMKIVMIT